MQRFNIHHAPSVADVLGGIHIGRTFWVVAPGHTLLPEIEYNLPEGRVHPTIAYALAAAEAGRNDRVIVAAEENHDAGTGHAENVAAAGIDSIGLFGLNMPLVGSTGDVFTMSSDNFTLAGFYMKPASGKSGIVVDACDFWTIRDCVIAHAATAAGSYCIELGNTTAANFGRVINNLCTSGLNGIWFEIVNDLLIRGNRLIQTGAASTIGIEETLTGGTALRNLILENFIMTHATTATGIKLANDTAYSHFVSRNVIVGAATPITQDKWNEGVASDNVVYTGTAVFGVADPAA